MQTLAEGLNEAGKHFLGISDSNLADLNLRQLKYAISEMIDLHDPNYPHNHEDFCSDCNRVRDENGRVTHAVNCAFDTFAKFLKCPQSFGFNQ